MNIFLSTYLQNFISTYDLFETLGKVLNVNTILDTHTKFKTGHNIASIHV